MKKVVHKFGLLFIAFVLRSLFLAQHPQPFDLQKPHLL